MGMARWQKERGMRKGGGRGWRWRDGREEGLEQ